MFELLPKEKKTQLLFSFLDFQAWSFAGNADLETVELLSIGSESDKPRFHRVNRSSFATVRPKGRASNEMSGISPKGDGTNPNPTYISFYCNLCQKPFSNQSGLSRHMILRHGDPRSQTHQCDRCTKSFATLSSLKKHVNMHDGKFSYTCQVCWRGFANAGNLQGHMSQHTNEASFKCQMCRSTFKSRSGLFMHKKKAHPELY